jgi:hypothetical protein
MGQVRRGVVFVLALAACYAPAPSPGSPCTEDRQCPSPLVCSPATQTCEHDAAAIDAPAPPTDATDGPPMMMIDAAPACAPCEPNDGPAGAIDVTAGGTFTGNALQASDDVASTGCGGSGGRDLFFKVTLTKPEVYYFDTFTSSFDTVVRVYTKACALVGGGANPAACSDDICAGAQSQIALSLPAGESCIVVDQRSSAETTGAVTLHVLRGRRDGLPLAAGVHTSTGDTCTSSNIDDPVDVNCDGPGSGGKDHAYFFTTCPGQSMLLDADLCPAPAWDPVLYVRRVSTNAQIGCNDDSCAAGPAIANVSITNGTLFFLYVDGFAAAECGSYSLDTNLR